MNTPYTKFFSPFLHLGLCLLAMSNGAVAWGNLDSLQALSKRTDDQAQLAAIHLKMCAELSQLSRYDDAEELAIKALSHYKESMAFEKQAECLIELGQICERRREWSKGKKLLFEAMDLYQGLKNEQGIALAHSRLGELFAWEGGDENFIRAKEHLFEAIGYRLENGDNSLIANDYFQLAHINFQQGNPGKTLEYYYKVIELSRQSPSQQPVKSNRLAAAYANSGGVYRDAEENGLAIEYYLKALESLPDNANASNQAIMNLQLGKLYINTKEYSKAKDRLFAGRGIALKFGHDLRVHNANLSLAELYLANGQLDSALFYIQLGLRFNETSNWEAGQTHLVAGNYFLEKKDMANAQHHFGKSVEIGKLSKAHLGLSQCAEQAGDFETAFNELKVYKMKSDSLVEIRKIPAVHLSETKQEIALMEKERVKRQVAAEKAAKESNFLQYSAILLTIVILLLILNLVVNVAVPHVLVRAAAFITVLTLFEFALVFLDPKIELLSEGEPLKKLGINLMIAVFIFPLHSFIESRITRISNGKMAVSGAQTTSS